MSITLSPMPSLDLGRPTLVKVRIPIDLLAHFGLAVDPAVENVYHLIHKTKSVARVIAERLSMALFGSTESLLDPFIHWLGSHRDEPVQPISFTLSHKIAHDGLNPVYLRIPARLVDGKVVFGVEEVTGELQQTLNYRHEVEEADLRKSMIASEGGKETDAV